MRALLALVLGVAVVAVCPSAVMRARSQGLAQHDSQEDGRAAAPAAAPVIRPIHVDVLVTDNLDRPVENLKLSDFELREDGKSQTLDEVRLITGERASGQISQIETGEDERIEAARPGTRLFAIFLDEYHVSAARSARVREAVMRFVDNNVEPQDLIVVRRPLESLLALRMTRDRNLVRQRIDEFEGRRGDYTPRNDYERDYIAGTPARVEQLRDQVTTSALSALAVHLGSLNREVRKTLIVVSEGLPRVNRRRGLESLPTLDSVIRAANRSNVSVYSVDPRDAAVENVSANEEDALRALVVATDGRSIGAVGDLSIAMRPIATDSSVYYMLSYRPTQKADGRLHDVQVTVKRAGVRVRTRKGYWAAISGEGLRANASRPATGVALGPPRRISPLIRLWFGASRGTDGKTRVTFVWEPAARVPGDRTRQAPAALVVLKALGADGSTLWEGSVRPTGTVRLDPADEAQTRAIFDAPPGPLRIQMSIEDAATQAIDSDVREITVRDLRAAVALGTPEILRSRSARDYRALEKDP